MRLECAGKILVVDDLKTNILLIKEVLEKKEYDVYFNTDAEFAIQMINESQFDLILLDIVMPKINGYQVCKHIRYSELNSKTPIIFITTRNDEKSIIDGFEKGAQDYIIKPFNEKELLARVNTQIELKKHRNKLEQLNLYLEEMVNERTEELNCALAKIRIKNSELKRARDELKDLDIAKQNFLQIISHEIRTPLNGILGFSELVKETCKDKEYLEYLDSMNESVKRLERFSMEALLITQLNTGMYQIKLVKASIKNLVSKAIGLLEKHITNKCLDIEYDIPEEYELTTDIHLAHSVLFNLIENAVQHSPVKGIIRITAKKLSGHFQISISDQGEGFSDHTLKNTNKAFVSNNFIDNNPGIGLYTSHLIMRYLYGNMKLQNGKEYGARVFVNFVIKKSLTEHE
ncbi:MAG: hybrid sensor histidine kinase/response regulator [Bacteroidales bacterium]|jgi:two-component system sensor histidine kinase/response regulator